MDVDSTEFDFKEASENSSYLVIANMTYSISCYSSISYLIFDTQSQVAVVHVFNRYR